MFDYKITAYNKLGKVQEVETVFCAPDEIDGVMYDMSEQYGYAEAVDPIWYLDDRFGNMQPFVSGMTVE